MSGHILLHSYLVLALCAHDPRLRGYKLAQIPSPSIRDKYIQLRYSYLPKSYTYLIAMPNSFKMAFQING